MRHLKILKTSTALLIACTMMFRPLAVSLVYAEDLAVTEPTASPTSEPTPADSPAPPPADEPADTSPPPTDPPPSPPEAPPPLPTSEPTPEPVLEPTPEPSPSISPDIAFPSPTPDIPTILDEILPSPDPSPLLPTIPVDSLAVTANEATVSANTASTSTTGGNSSEGSTTTVTTGAADSQSSTSNTANTTNPQTPPSSPALTFLNENKADAATNTLVVADTGQNQSLAQYSSQIASGDALAIANVINLLNLNSLDSLYTIIVINVTPDQLNDIDLNQIWKELTAAAPSSSPFVSSPNDQLAALINHNQIKLYNYMYVSAATGGNSSQADTTAITSGNATAAANLINVANGNLILSRIFIGLINILPGSTGNLILPAPESFTACAAADTAIPHAVINLNQASVSGQLVTSAGTGDNLQVGPDNNLSTGTAVALANDNSFINLSFINSSWFYFTLLNAGGWSGSVNGWGNPANQELYNVGAYTFQLTGSAGLGLLFATPLTVINANDAAVTNDVTVTATTGNNSTQSQNSSTITTGRATALSNIFNLVNFNLINSNWFISLANILGGWSGNVIFAYPDVTVAALDDQKAVEPGDTVNYTFSYTNKGYEAAKQVALILDIPSYFTYLSDTSGQSPQQADHQLTWSIDHLDPRQSNSFTVTLKVDQTFDFQNQTAQLPFIIHQAYAADTSLNKSVPITINITTPDPESNTLNNSATVTTVVYEVPDNASPPVPAHADDDQSGVGQSDDNRLPTLNLEAVNNVNQFVYPGDTVTFELKLNNAADVAATDTVITHEVYTADDQLISTTSFTVGTVNAHKSGTLRFGLIIPKNNSMPGGSYYTVSQASAVSPNQTRVYSNEPETTFAVKSSARITLAVVSPVTAPNTSPVAGAFLGLQTQAEDILPYLILVLLCSLWFVIKQKIRQANWEVFPAARSRWQTVTSSLAYSFVLVVFLFSIYKINNHYGLIKTNPTIKTAYYEVTSRLIK